MLHSKFRQNRPAGSWKENLSSVFPVYGHGSHLGNVTSIILMNLHLSTFRSQAAIVSEKSIVFTFSYRKT